MFAGTSDITRQTPKVMNRVTCDTIVEITETPAYLISFRLEGWAMIWRIRATIGSSDDQMCFSGGCSWGFVGVEVAARSPRDSGGEGGTRTPYPWSRFRLWGPIRGLL